MRVIAGAYKGRRLQTTPGNATRPTSDRVREALFSILGDRVEGARVLDLFAGSGALAIEALSRGADSAVMVESDPRAVAAIRTNVDAIGDAGARVEPVDALAWLRRARGEYDLVFLDPPYSSARDLGGKLSQALPAVLSKDAHIVTESDKRDPLILDLPLEDERTYGHTRVAIHRAAH